MKITLQSICYTACCWLISYLYWLKDHVEHIANKEPDSLKSITGGLILGVLNIDINIVLHFVSIIQLPYCKTCAICCITIMSEFWEVVRMGSGISLCFWVYMRGGVWLAIPKSFLCLKRIFYFLVMMLLDIARAHHQNPWYDCLESHTNYCCGHACRWEWYR